jgi:hypothetical protein
MAAGTISGRGGFDLTVALEATRHALCFVCQRYRARSILGIWASWKTSRPGQPQDRVSFGHILATRRSPASREGSRPGVEASRASAEYSGAWLRPRPAIGGTPIDARLAYAVGREVLRGLREGQNRRDGRGVDLGFHPRSYGPREAPGRALDWAPHTRH